MPGPVASASDATTVGLALTPSGMVLLGNPQLGTPPMRRPLALAIDLLLTLSVRQNGDRTWVTARYGSAGGDAEPVPAA